MKPKFVLLTLCALASLAVLSVFVVRLRMSPAKSMAAAIRTFEVRGQVRSVDVTNRTVRITHEAIPDYMPAMTMPLTVKDTALLQGLAAGDSVQFQLAVTGDDSWIARLEKIAGEPAGGLSAANSSNASQPDREAERVHVGEAVPDFTLVNQDGHPVRLSDLRGKAVLLTFIYTRCPLPNYCPLMSRNFADLEKRLNKEFAGKYQLLSITMDSEFDTPAVLKEYAARYQAKAGDWTFATGDAEQIATVARLMGLYFAWENGVLSHDLRTALIGPDGRLVHLWKSNVWTPYEVERFVRETLTPGRGLATQ